MTWQVERELVPATRRRRDRHTGATGGVGLVATLAREALRLASSRCATVAAAAAAAVAAAAVAATEGEAGAPVEQNHHTHTSEAFASGPLTPLTKSVTVSRPRSARVVLDEV